MSPVTVSTALTPDLKSYSSDPNAFWPTFMHDVDVVADHGRAVVNDLPRKSLGLQSFFPCQTVEHLVVCEALGDILHSYKPERAGRKN